MPVWRCYTFTNAAWREWGIDFPTLRAARASIRQWRATWPNHRFTIRRGKAAS